MTPGFSRIAVAFAVVSLTACGGAASVPLALDTDTVTVGAIAAGGTVTFAVSVPGSGSHTLRICPATAEDACDDDPVDLTVTSVAGPRDPSLVLGTLGQVRLAHLWEATVMADLIEGATYRVYCAVPFHGESGEQTLVTVGR